MIFERGTQNKHLSDDMNPVIETTRRLLASSTSNYLCDHLSPHNPNRGERFHDCNHSERCKRRVSRVHTTEVSSFRLASQERASGLHLGTTCAWSLRDTSSYKTWAGDERLRVGLARRKLSLGECIQNQNDIAAVDQSWQSSMVS